VGGVDHQFVGGVGRLRRLDGAADCRDLLVTVGIDDDVAAGARRNGFVREIAVDRRRLLGVVMNRVTSATEQPYLAYYGAYVR